MRDLRQAMENLKRVRGLSGAGLIRGGVWTYQDLPYYPAECETLRDRLIEMFQSYANEGRLADRIAFGDEGQWFMVLNWQTILLVMIYPDGEETEMVERSGLLFLKQFAAEVDRPPPAEPEPGAPLQAVVQMIAPAPPPAWSRLRPELERLLSKVMSGAQSVSLIERELQAQGLNSGNPVPPERFRGFVTHILEQVRDRAVRKQLMDEAETILRRYG